MSDAEFIAHARADIPALLRHIAALEARTPAPACPKCDTARRAPCRVAGERSEGMTNDALIKEARDIDKTREHWPLIKRLADALTAANAREAQAEAERDAALKRMDIAERERDTAVARLHAAEDLVVKNAIERDAYKQSADGAGVVICRIKAERDAARAHIAALRREAGDALEKGYWEACLVANLGTYKSLAAWNDSNAAKAAERLRGESK